LGSGARRGGLLLYAAFFRILIKAETRILGAALLAGSAALA